MYVQFDTETHEPNRAGTIPESIGNLTNLQYLNSTDNSLTGA